MAYSRECAETPAGLKAAVASVSSLLARLELPQVRSLRSCACASCLRVTRRHALQQFDEQNALNALYETTEARSELAARLEALAARARASAWAYLPGASSTTAALWTASATVPVQHAQPASATAEADVEAELPSLALARGAMDDAVGQLLRASDAAPDEVRAAAAVAAAQVQAARSKLAAAAAAVGAQLKSERAAATELRGALEEALEDAREAETQLAAERNRVAALEAHLRNVLSSDHGRT